MIASDSSSDESSSSNIRVRVDSVLRSIPSNPDEILAESESSEGICAYDSDDPWFSDENSGCSSESDVHPMPQIRTPLAQSPQVAMSEDLYYTSSDSERLVGYYEDYERLSDEFEIDGEDILDEYGDLADSLTRRFNSRSQRGSAHSDKSRDSSGSMHGSSSWTDMRLKIPDSNSPHKRQTRPSGSSSSAGTLHNDNSASFSAESPRSAPSESPTIHENFRKSKSASSAPSNGFFKPYEPTVSGQNTPPRFQSDSSAISGSSTPSPPGFSGQSTPSRDGSAFSGRGYTSDGSAANMPSRAYKSYGSPIPTSSGISATNSGTFAKTPTLGTSRSFVRFSWLVG